jgi:hypothetical protein
MQFIHSFIVTRQSVKVPCPRNDSDCRGAIQSPPLESDCILLHQSRGIQRWRGRTPLVCMGHCVKPNQIVIGLRGGHQQPCPCCALRPAVASPGPFVHIRPCHGRPVPLLLLPLAPLPSIGHCGQQLLLCTCGAITAQLHSNLGSFSIVAQGNHLLAFRQHLPELYCVD